MAMAQKRKILRCLSYVAQKRMKDEEKDELVSDVPWAYYPADILFVMIICCVYEELYIEANPTQGFPHAG